MRSKAMKREALQAAKEAKKERGEYCLADIKVFCKFTLFYSIKSALFMNNQ